MSFRQALLGEICELKYGKSLPAAIRKPGPATVYGSNGPVDTHEEPLLPGPAIIVGRKGSYGEVHFADGPLWPIDTTYYVDKSSTSCDLRWLHHLLQFLPLTTLNRSAAIPGLSREDAYRLPVTVPPLSEQRRIAAILDKADALRRKRRQALDLLDSLTQSIFLEMFGRPGDLNGKVLQRPLAEIAELINGDRSSNYPSGDDLKSSGVLFLNTSCITPRGLDVSAANYISLEKFASLTRGKLSEGDIVITLRGSLGQAAVFEGCGETGFINAQMMIIRPRPAIESTFLLAALQLDDMMERYRRMGSGSAVPQLTSRQMADLPVPVPSYKDQLEFARRRKSIQLSFQRMQSDCELIDGLFASLQSRAFSGQL